MIILTQDAFSSFETTTSVIKIKENIGPMKYITISAAILQTCTCVGMWLNYRTQKTTDSQIFSINKPSASTDNFHEQKLTQNIKNENNRKTECIDLIKQLNKDISPKEFGNQTLSILSQHYNITQGILYKAQEPYLSILSTFAYYEDENKSFEFGQGLAGQVAKAQRIVNIQSIPAGYIKIISGLGESTPTNLLVCPLIVDGKTIGVLEVAAFEEFSKEDENNFEIIASELTNILHTANG